MKKQLTRSDNRLVAGVVAGLAEYFDHDVTLYRLLFVFGLLLTGVFPLVILYLVAWVLMSTTHITEPITDIEYEVR